MNVSLSPTKGPLCGSNIYVECGIYINKHGDVSRSSVIDFVGTALSATVDLPYLLLFHADFLEVRHLKSGELCQIIAGETIRCPDNGQSGIEKRSVMISMMHPTWEDHQLVLELVSDFVFELL